MKRMRRLVPVALIVAGVWGLAGCFYLPLPEHVATGEKDFRTILGEKKSQRPLSVGIATRGSVRALLGEPPYIADDGRSVAYFFKTEGSQWVLPLCAHADPATEGYYAVRLRFDEREVLTEWNIAHASEDYGFYPVHASVTPQVAVDKLNLHGSTLRAVSSRK